jgi:hypothetical protein
MRKIKRLGCAFVLIAISAVMVRSQNTADEYVTPAEAVPTGKAPKMQVQLLNPGEPTKQYAVIFYQGDEVYSGLQEFAEKYHVNMLTGRRRVTCSPCRRMRPARIFPFAESRPKNPVLLPPPTVVC